LPADSSSSYTRAVDDASAWAALEKALATTQSAALQEAPKFVTRKAPTKAQVDAAAKAGKKPPATRVVRTPFVEAYPALHDRYIQALLKKASDEATRYRVRRRVDLLLREVLASVGIAPPPRVATPQRPYVPPVTPGTVRMRTDSGVDFQGEPGDPTLAIGNAVVTSVRKVGGFGMLAVYRLLEGPRAGQHIYAGHSEPVVRQGQRLKAGAPVTRLKEHSYGIRKTSPHSRGWVEIGFAAGPLGLPESYEEHDPGVEHDLSTRAGVEFSTFLRNRFGI
jgi:murein DD-endopeptidase MepM/ murein hydrolase activator NlpD